MSMISKENDDNDTINKYEFYWLIDQDVKCCIECCKKSMSNFNFAYIKHNLYFCDKPHVLCPECFDKKEEESSNFIPRQFKHLPKNIWKPQWIKVWINKK